MTSSELEHEFLQSALRGPFALSNGAVSGAYLLAIGCGSMLLIAGAVGAWVVRDRHAKSPAIAGHPSQ